MAICKLSRQGQILFWDTNELCYGQYLDNLTKADQCYDGYSNATNSMIDNAPPIKYHHCTDSEMVNPHWRPPAGTYCGPPVAPPLKVS